MGRKQEQKARTAYLISTISVTLVLFMIGSAAYFIMNAGKATDEIVENIKISLVLKDDATRQEISEADSVLKANPMIQKSEFVSKEKAIADFREFIGQDMFVDDEFNPLPASYNIFLKKEANRSQVVAELQQAFEGKEYIDELIHQTTQIDQITRNLSSFMLVVGIFGVCLLFVSIILVNNTVRMSVFAKRFLIKSMLLIGATPGFIRKPFIQRALIQSLISALLAFVMLLLLIMGILKVLPGIELIQNDYEKFAIIAGFMVAIGAVVCVLSSLFAVNRYMKCTDDDLNVF